MDLLSRIASWLGENEATISAVAAILAITVIVFTGLRFVLRRRGETATAKAPAGTVEATSATDSSAPDLDPLTVPDFEERPAIAVLPFDNLSGDPDQEYFADGIAEDLITLLSTWRDFPVIARNSSFVYKGRAVDVKQVSRELGVRYLVEGSVRKERDRVRITAQLIDATTGGHVWARRYDRELSDIFALQDEITEAIVASMYPEVLKSEREHAARREPDDLDAWDCAQRGFWHMSKGNKGETKKARSLFEKATELDPQLTTAFQGLGNTHHQDLARQWTDSPAESLAELEKAARSCIALDEKSAWGHYLLGAAYRLTGQRDKEIAEFELAIQLNPSFTLAYHELGITLAMSRRPDEALAYLEKAIRLSPQDPNMFLFLSGAAMAHSAARRYEEAVEWSRRSIQRNREWYLPYLTLAVSCVRLGRFEEARAAAQDLLRVDPNFSLAVVELHTSGSEAASAQRNIDLLRSVGFPE